MTGEQLREELTRIAESAPQVRVPDGLFAKGRRATIRARVLAGAAAVACLGLVAALAVPLLRTDGSGLVADGYQPPGVPDRIYAEDPEHPGPEVPVTPLDEVGHLVAAYLTDDGSNRVVAVTEDGDYRMIRLPDLWEPSLDETSPLLSPDGLRLAYTSAVDGRRGLSIVDLTTGQVRDIRLTADLGALVRTVQWSPDSRSIVWSGQEVASVNGSSASYRSRIIGGLILAREEESRVLPPGGGASWDGVGVCDSGTLVRYVWPVYLLGPDGRERTRSWAEVQREHGPCAAPATVVQLDSGTRLLGWLPREPDDSVPTAVVLDPDEDDDGSWSTSTLGLLQPGGSVDAVGTVDSVGISNLSVATWRMSVDRPTVPAGEDPWARSPWISEHWRELLILLVIGTVAILVVVRARAVRR